MAVIMDYLAERGDLPFAEAPFNEVDNYIIAKIGTPNFDLILPEDGHAVPLEEALSAYFERYGDAGNYLGALASPEIGPVLRRLPGLARYRGLLLSHYVRRHLPEETEQFELPLHEGLVETPLGLFRISFLEGTEGFVRSCDIAFLDMDKIEKLGERPMIRNRRDGDRFRPVGAPGRRKLKEYFIDRKVDRESRDRIPLIACGSEVLFVPGFAASEQARVDENTARMLRAEYLGRTI